MTVGAFFQESAVSLGKTALRKHIETPFTYGFLVTSSGVLLFWLTALARWDAQVFDWASLPTVSVRIVFEILLAWVVVEAVNRADLSTFGFLRTLTLPFLLVVDVALAYRIDTLQIVGMMLIVLALFLLFMNHGFSRKGAWMTVGTACLAVVTVSLYKYNVTHFNSPEVEQLIAHTALLIFFGLMSMGVERSHPFALFRRPVCLAQAGLSAVGFLLTSFSFLYAAPSVLMTANRASGLFAAIFLGRAVFHEKKLLLKVSAAGLISVGFLLLLL